MATIKCNGEVFEIKEVEPSEDYARRHPGDKWGTCQHIWKVEDRDWDAPPCVICVECTLCGVPGQYYEKGQYIYWPTT